MILGKRLLISTILVALPAAGPASAAPWVRSFVVGSHEYAFRYGGRASFAHPGEIEPGVDCPHGSTLHFANPDQTRKAVARQNWRLPHEAEWVAVPPGLDAGGDFDGPAVDVEEPEAVPAAGRVQRAGLGDQPDAGRQQSAGERVDVLVAGRAADYNRRSTWLAKLYAA